MLVLGHAMLEDDPGKRARPRRDDQKGSHAARAGAGVGEIMHPQPSCGAYRTLVQRKRGVGVIRKQLDQGIVGQRVSHPGRSWGASARRCGVRHRLLLKSDWHIGAAGGHACFLRNPDAVGAPVAVIAYAARVRITKGMPSSARGKTWTG